MDSAPRKRAINNTNMQAEPARARKWLPLIRGFVLSDGFLLLIGVLGIVLRIAVYLDNRPFWTDEAQLALNIRSRTMLQLLGHLDFCQAAPPGFLLLEKLSTSLFGESEGSVAKTSRKN